MFKESTLIYNFLNRDQFIPCCCSWTWPFPGSLSLGQLWSFDVPSLQPTHRPGPVPPFSRWCRWHSVPVWWVMLEKLGLVALQWWSSEKLSNAAENICESTQSILRMFGKHVHWQKHCVSPNVCILVSVPFRTSPCFPWWPCGAHRICASWDARHVWSYFVLWCSHHSEGRNPIL